MYSLYSPVKLNKKLHFHEKSDSSNNPINGASTQEPDVIFCLDLIKNTQQNKFQTVLIKFRNVSEY